MANTKQHTYSYEQRVRNLEKSREILASLPDYCTDFINDKLSSEKFQPRTCYAYACDLQLFFNYLCMDSHVFSGKKPIDINLDILSKLTYRNISDYLSFLTAYHTDDGQIRSNSAASKARKLSTIRSLYNYLNIHHRLEDNPCIGVDMPKIKEKPIIRLADKEQESMYNSLDKGVGLIDRQKNNNDFLKCRDNAILTLFLGTGIRVSELVGINLEDINDINSCILVTRKGNKIQNVYLSSGVLDALYLYIDTARSHFNPDEAERALFLSQKGNRISVSAVERMIKKYANAALGVGNKISPHKLRSTYGTNLYLATGDIYLTADALGHSNVQTTAKHYADMTEQRRMKAATYADSLIHKNS